MANINLGKKIKNKQLMWPFRNISLDKKQREKAGLFSQHFASGTKRRERHIPVGAYNLYLIFEDPYSSLKKSISHSTKVCNIHMSIYMYMY